MQRQAECCPCDDAEHDEQESGAHALLQLLAECCLTPLALLRPVDDQLQHHAVTSTASPVWALAPRTAIPPRWLPPLCPLAQRNITPITNNHVAARGLPLQGGDLLRRVKNALSLHALLLQHLQEDGRGRRLRYDLGAQAKTLKVQGKEHMRIYHAKMRDDGSGKETTSSAERHFCGVCGTHLWLFSPEWPDLLHPLASAVDTDLPTPPEQVHMMLKFKANWVPDAGSPEGPGYKHFQEYPKESIEEWHRRQGLFMEGEEEAAA